MRLPLRPTARRLARRLLGAATALALTGCGGVVELEPGDPVAFVTQPQTSQVLASDGSVLAELHAEEDRRDVPLDAVSVSMLQAVVAIEDRRFFLHAGVDVAAIARAAVRNVTEGGIEEGGSTLTQQYVKNTMTGSAQTLDRKLREAALAFQLEQRYSKAEILERYLNTVYFGRGAYGVHAAAERFFGIGPEALDLAQAATLAGMIASPSRFDPYEHPARARARRGLVLDAMVATGQVDRAEADAAADAELDLEPLETDPAVVAPYAVDEVKRLLQHDPDGRFAMLGDTVDERAATLFTVGLRIVTTLDLTIQQQAEAAVAEVLPGSGPSAAVVATDPRSGAVRALVGGRDYFDGDDPHARFNLATQGRRQPGSSFKPVVVATALSRGVGLDQSFPGGDCVAFADVAGWEDGVCNYGGTDYGELTLREATIRSVNTVFARLAVDLGPTAILETAQTLGLRDLPAVPSLALGAGEVTPWDLAGAYSPFAALGRWTPPYLIERIETASGEVLYEHEDVGYDAIDDGVAYLVTQTLEEVVARGTGVRARIDRPQAGKTGTSQDSADAWFVGYTPSFLASVWVGFPEGRVPMVPPRTSEVVEGGRWPAEIWRRLAAAALAGVAPEPFPVPDVDVVMVDVDVTRNCLPNPYTPPDVVEERAYVVGTEPTERCTEPTGPPIDDVPAVVGLPANVAERLLADRGFTLDVRPIASRLYPPGVVIRQRPEAGGTTLATDGNAVVVWVSTASRLTRPVPDVVGLDAASATTALEAAGWVVDVRRRCPTAACDGLTPGGVWATTPAAGTMERVHAVVTLDVVPDSAPAQDVSPTPAP